MYVYALNNNETCIYPTLQIMMTFLVVVCWNLFRVGFKYPHRPESIPHPRYAFKKTIIPTDRIFQAGLHMHGTCALGKKWRVGDQTANVSSLHKFEERVLDADFKRIPSADATIYHFQMHRSYEKADAEALQSKNQYAIRYFPAVLKELTRKGLNVLATIPDNALIVATADTEWPSIDESIFTNDTTAELKLGNLKNSVTFGKLPAFSGDLSEMFMGSVIERSFDSRDLHITTFLLCHSNLLARKYSSINKLAVIESQSIEKWSKWHSAAGDRRYSETGSRNNYKNFHCKITNFYGAQPYKVKGHFIPNKLSVDRNANGLMDIFRCPMRNLHSIDDLSVSLFEVSVEIFNGNNPLVKFRVPWKTRRAGFMLSNPTAPSMSRLNMWKHLAQPDAAGDDLHMCVPGFESPITKRSLAIYAEFLQHHHDVGVQHVHAAAAYMWGETNMNLFTESLLSFIDEGFLSIVSLSQDADRVSGWLGLSLDRDVVKVMYVNMCLYLTKGMVSYLAVWDIDEYFIPQLPHHTIMDVIRAAEAPKPLVPLPPSANPFELVNTWIGGRGWADGDAHPFCYLRLLSKTFYRSTKVSQKSDLFSPWIGNRYIDGPEDYQGLNFEKAILPTRKIFQAGLHTGAGCKLEYPFSGCGKEHKEEFCEVDKGKYAQKYGYTVIRDPVSNTLVNTTDFSFEQRFNGFIFNKDAKTIDPDTQALLYHIQIHREELTANSQRTDNDTRNDYVSRFYPSVLQNLRRRGIEIKVIIPGVLKNKDINTIDKLLGWIEFNNDGAL
jgi:hypothetical protein